MVSLFNISVAAATVVCTLLLLFEVSISVLPIGTFVDAVLVSIAPVDGAVA